MKSLAELRALREKMLSQTDNRSVAGKLLISSDKNWTLRPSGQQASS